MTAKVQQGEALRLLEENDSARAAPLSNYILGPDAALDLDDIWEYIADDSSYAADQWIESGSMLRALPSSKWRV